MWAETRPALEEAGYEVVAPDLPGPAAERTLASWADRVLRLVDGPLVLVGVSMGGYLAFELWRRASERVRALVLVSTRAGGETGESRAGREANLRLLRENGVTALWEVLGGKLFAPGTSPDVVARAREIALEQGSQRLAAATEAIRDRPDSRSLLAEITVPVLVVAGEDDRVIPPSESEALARALPDARLELIPGAGHLVPLERPPEFARVLLPFLAEVAA